MELFLSESCHYRLQGFSSIGLIWFASSFYWRDTGTDVSALKNCICSQLATFAQAYTRQQMWPFIHMCASSCIENSYNFFFEGSDNPIFKDILYYCLQQQLLQSIATQFLHLLLPLLFPSLRDISAQGRN